MATNPEEMNPTAAAAQTARRAESVSFSDYFSTEDDIVTITISAEGKPDWYVDFAGMDPDTLAYFRRLNNGVGRKDGNQEAAFQMILKKKFIELRECPFTLEGLDKYGGSVLTWLLKSPGGRMFTAFVVPKYLELVSPEVEEKN